MSIDLVVVRWLGGGSMAVLLSEGLVWGIVVWVWSSVVFSFSFNSTHTHARACAHSRTGIERLLFEYDPLSSSASALLRRTICTSQATRRNNIFRQFLINNVVLATSVFCVALIYCNTYTLYAVYELFEHCPSLWFVYHRYQLPWTKTLYTSISLPCYHSSTIIKYEFFNITILTSMQGGNTGALPVNQR